MRDDNSSEPHVAECFDLQRLDLRSLLALVYEGTEPLSLVGIGTLRDPADGKPSGIQPYVPIPVHKIDKMLPKVLMAIEKEEAYFLVNSLAPNACDVRRYGFRGHAIPFRKALRNLDRINAIAITVTVEGSTPTETFLQYLSAVGVPLASILLVDGENITALWLLTSVHTHRQPVHPADRRVLLMITDEIVRRLPDLRPKARAAKDLSKWLCVPTPCGKVRALLVGDARYFTPAELRSGLADGAADDSPVFADPEVLYGDLRRKWEAKRNPDAKRRRSRVPDTCAVRRRDIEAVVRHREGQLSEEQRQAVVFHYFPAAFRDALMRDDKHDDKKGYRAYTAALTALIALPIRLIDAESEVRTHAPQDWWITPKNTTVIADLDITESEMVELRLTGLVSPEIRERRVVAARLRTAHVDVVKDLRSRYMDELIQRGYSLRLIEKATGRAINTIARRRDELLGDQEVPRHPLKPAAFSMWRVESVIGNEKVWWTESSHDLAPRFRDRDDEEEDEFFSRIADLPLDS